MSDLRPTAATRQRMLTYRLRLILSCGLLCGPAPQMASLTSKPPSKPVQALKLLYGSQTYYDYSVNFLKCQGFGIVVFFLFLYDIKIRKHSFDINLCYHVGKIMI